MIKDVNQQILDRYDERFVLYNEFAKKMEDLGNEIVRAAGVQALSVTSRLKERDSLSDKLQRLDKNYSSLEDVTDIAGVRITTYFADDVDKIAERIELEFDVDSENSTNKGDVLDPDRFGYLSWHHVVSLGHYRASLPEYSRFVGLKAEIQTRSVLQHAWAEIEHDLGYKTRLGVPKAFRRRLSRLAGLLELADQEFEDIRDGLTDYERNVPEKIENEPQLVEIDKASLTAFINENALVNDIDQAISSSTGMLLDKTLNYLDQSAVIESYVAKLKRLQVLTIEDLDIQLLKRKQDVVEFAVKWITEVHSELVVPGSSFTSGVSVNYLTRILAAETQDAQTIKEVELLTPKGRRDTDPEARAEQILNVYQSMHAEGS